MSGERSLSRFFKHSSIYALGNALNRVGAFVLLPLYTRQLSVAQYGTLELYYAIAAVVSSVLSVGIAHATLRFYFEFAEVPDRKAVVSTNMIASFGISAAGAVVFGLLAGPLAQALLGARPSSLGLVLILLTLTFELSSQVGLAYLRAEEKSVTFIAITLVKLLLQCGTNIFLLTHVSASVEAVLAGNAIAVAAGWAIVGGIVARQCGLRFEWAKLRPTLQYSLPFLYVTLIATVSSNLDRFSVTRLLSLEALGVFALATKFAKLVSDLIGEPFNRAYGAFRFSIMKRPDAAAIQVAVLRYVSAGLGLVCLALAFFTGDVIDLFANASYRPAAALMPLLLLGAALQMTIYILQTGILVNKSTRDLVTITIVRSTVQGLGVYPMIWAFGLQGACAMAALDGLLGCVLTWRFSQRYHPIAYDLRRVGVLCALLAGFFAASLLLPAGAATVAGKPALLAGFAVALWFTQLTALERAAAHGALRQRLSARSA